VTGAHQFDASAGGSGDVIEVDAENKMVVRNRQRSNTLLCLHLAGCAARIAVGDIRDGLIARGQTMSGAHEWETGGVRAPRGRARIRGRCARRVMDFVQASQGRVGLCRPASGHAIGSLQEVGWCWGRGLVVDDSFVEMTNNERDELTVPSSQPPPRSTCTARRCQRRIKATKFFQAGQLVL